MIVIPEVITMVIGHIIARRIVIAVDGLYDSFGIVEFYD